MDVCVVFVVQGLVWIISDTKKDRRIYKYKMDQREITGQEKKKNPAGGMDVCEKFQALCYETFFTVAILGARKGVTWMDRTVFSLQLLRFLPPAYSPVFPSSLPLCLNECW
jgi:hypothetical protein